MKTLFILFCLIFNLCAATTSHTGQYITSSVSMEDGEFFKYSYFMEPRLIEKKELSHFEVFYCEEVAILSPESTLRFQTETESGGFKWDSLKGNSSGVVSFSFFSKNTPILGNGEIKFGTSVFQDTVIVPSCNTIPETSTIGLLFCGLLLTTRRKR